MITGHNTDVEYAGRVYHVQTEDRGKEHPVIETLVYTKGEILDSRKTPYAELMKGGHDEKLLIRMMEAQHRRVIREVRNGRYDPEGPKPFGADILLAGRTLDEVVLEWLRSDRGGNGLQIELSSWEALRAGEETAIDVTVRRSADHSGAAGARLVVRLEGRTEDRPLFEGDADAEGAVAVRMTIPSSAAAPRAKGVPKTVARIDAVVFEARLGEHVAELTRPVHPGLQGS